MLEVKTISKKLADFHRALQIQVALDLHLLNRSQSKTVLQIYQDSEIDREIIRY